MDFTVLVSSLLLVIGSLVFFNDASITSAAVFNIIDCGSLNSPGTYLLTQDVSSQGTCFFIGSHHVTVDCQGNEIQYSIDGNPGQAGVLNSNFNNLTVQNCVIINANAISTGSHAGIDSRQSSDSSFINNDISTLGSVAKGIIIQGSYRNLIERNTIQAAGGAASAITLNTAHNATIRFNTITGTFGNGAFGINLVGTTRDALVEGNDVRSYDSAVHLSGNVNRTILLNNNLFTQLSNRNEINDALPEANINYLIFNNSFGEIRWIDDNSGGFLRNLNVNSPDPNGFGLGRGINIGPNLVSVDAAIVGGQGSLVDSTVLMTLKDLPFVQYVNQVLRTNTIEIDSAAVLAQGVDCLGTSCLYFCYDGNAQKFKFTSFSLSDATPQSSFTVNQNTVVGQIYVEEDVNDDGDINDDDITPIVNHVLGANELQGTLFYAADVTCDDALNIYDIESIVLAR